MEKKILSLEKHIKFLYEELEMKENEIDGFKQSSDDAKDSCRRMSTSRKNDLEDIDDLKKLVEEQKVKIFCLRKHRDEILDRHEKVIDDYEREFKAKENDIKHYQEVCLKQNNEISDDKEEISTKSLEIEELGKLLKKEKELKVYSNSISEELKIAGLKMEKTKLEQENLELKTKVEKLKESKKAHADEYLKLDEIFVNMKNEVKKLNQRLNRIEGKKKCSLKWNCNRLFCTFDHSFLYRKVNLKTSDHFKCDGRGKMCSRNCQLKEHEEICRPRALQVFLASGEASSCLSMTPLRPNIASGSPSTLSKLSFVSLTPTISKPVSPKQPLLRPGIKDLDCRFTISWCIIT